MRTIKRFPCLARVVEEAQAEEEVDVWWSRRRFISFRCACKEIKRNYKYICVVHVRLLVHQRRVQSVCGLGPNASRGAKCKVRAGCMQQAAGCAAKDNTRTRRIWMENILNILMGWLSRWYVHVHAVWRCIWAPGPSRQLRWQFGNEL